MSTAATTTATVTVTGMTCGCCANSVRDEIGRVPGVTAVAVDLTDGTVTVDSAAQLQPDVIATAVVRAGYSVAD